MPRESAFGKARRLLVEARVSILRAGPGVLQATVRGDSARIYRTSYAGGVWRCGCDHVAASTRCSHVLACQLIFVEEQS